MRFVMVVVLVCSSLPTFGQRGELQAHWEISVPISYQLTNRWSMNTTLASRTGFYERRLEDTNVNLFVNFVEATQFVTYKAEHNLTTTLGYRYRAVNPVEGERDYENRFIQQLGLVHFSTSFRLASRLRSEQRWRSESFSQRIRYRFSLDRPLSGEKLNIGELYGIFSNELVTEFNENSSNTLENRISVGLGNKWGQGSKIQLDVQLRSDDVLNQSSNTVFVMTSFYFNLN